MNALEIRNVTKRFSKKVANKNINLTVKKGEILETGTHEELVSKKGKYNELYSLQAKKYEH